MIYKFKEYKQQPLFLSKSDYLYLSDKLVNEIKPTKERLMKISLNKNSWVDYIYNKNEDFLNDIRNDKNYRKSTFMYLFMSVEFSPNMYNMSLLIGSKINYFSNDSGKFKYYLRGNSGDFEMHGKNMIRATRECNFKFILKLYPIVEHIKNFYKRFKNGELFLEIIESELINNPNLGKFGVPEELYDKYGHLERLEKYNL